MEEVSHISDAEAIIVELKKTGAESAFRSAADLTDDDAFEALSLVSRQLALVKTVKNGDWLRLLSRMAAPPSTPRFRTSLTLLPPSGRMHLYGQYGQCVGLCFDRRALDMSGALIWPSGYFAKTEFHMHVQPDGTVELTGGRSQHLLSLEALLEATLAQDSLAEPPLYNEISIPVADVTGLSAVFVRSDKEEDTLFAMGVRALIQHLFPALPHLPLLRLLGTADATIVPRQEQLCILRARAAAAPTTLVASTPRLPIDVQPFPELDLVERLELHCAHGIGRGSLRAAFTAIVREHGHANLAPHVIRCLCEVAVSDNVASAREVVRTAAPLLLEPILKRSRDGSPVNSVLDVDGNERAEATGHSSSPSASSAADSTAVACRTSVLASANTLRNAVSSTACSEGMLVALGAQITISELVAGRTAQRLERACTWLADWCRKAEPGWCDPRAMVFLATSWMEARQVDGNSDWMSFLSGQAVANRLRFHTQLMHLLDAQKRGEPLEFISQLYKLSSKLHKPCLRLRILQQVLGLDTRFTRDIVHGIICLAFDVFEDMGGAISGGADEDVGTDLGGDGGARNNGGADTSPVDPLDLHPRRPSALDLGIYDLGAPPPGSALDASRDKSPSSQPTSPLRFSSPSAQRTGGSHGPSSPPAGTGLDLDGFDEATRLEADALLGTGVPRRPSDPVGDGSRRTRVAYSYR